MAAVNAIIMNATISNSKVLNEQEIEINYLSYIADLKERTYI